MPRLKEKFFKARIFRKKGYSLDEISRMLVISKSTASLWVRDIILSKNAKGRLFKRITRAQFISAQKRIDKTNTHRRQCKERGDELFKEININKGLALVFCGMLYCCEGGKSDDRTLQFTNSDPKLVGAFVNLLRRAFELDENKFRVSLHLHSYHSKDNQINFWSKIVNIPATQFIKPYCKANAGKRIKNNYQGCANIRYNDVNVARELIGAGQAFLEKYGGVVQW